MKTSLNNSYIWHKKCMCLHLERLTGYLGRKHINLQIFKPPHPLVSWWLFFKLHIGYGRWDYTVTSTSFIKNESFLNPNNFSFFFISCALSYTLIVCHLPIETIILLKRKKNPILNNKITFYLWLKASVGKHT